MSAPDSDMDECYRHLNESFYSSSPAAYFEQRLNSLLVVAADDPEYGPRLRSGLTIAGETFTVSSNEHVESQLSEKQLRQFVTSETEVLLHHAAESLLRLFLAHESHAPCPWLNISMLTSFTRFWDAVDERFVKPVRDETELRALIADTILGNATHHVEIPIERATWDDAVERLTLWMRFFSRYLSQDASVYNAAKHGFTLCPEEAYVGFMNEQGKTLMSRSGPSLEILVRSEWSGDSRTWSLKTVWTSPIASWFFCSVATRIMESIFQVGRYRRLGKAEGGYLFLPECSPRDIEAEAGVPSGINSFRRTMLIETRRTFTG